MHDLTSCKQKNASEEQYQDKIERIFERLGWWRTDSHKYKKPIPWGSAKDLIPDIQLLKDCKEVLVVEIKKPNNILTERQVRQLDSYMHALKIQIGLYIGENIQLFYESENEKTPTSVCTIEINEDSYRKLTEKNQSMFEKKKPKVSDEEILRYIKENLGDSDSIDLDVLRKMMNDREDA